MTSNIPDEQGPGDGSQDSAEMARYGITCVSAHYYLYREFRYSNLMDAIAQAKRTEPER